VDRFGNCQLNIGADDVQDMPRTMRLVLGDEVRSATITTTFADIPNGGIGLVVDSYGMLAICRDQDSAATSLGLGVADAVSLFPHADSESSTGPTSVSIRPNK
jgi:S-adenosylmethionine hydrolase